MLSTINTGGGLPLNEVGKSNPGALKLSQARWKSLEGYEGEMEEFASQPSRCSLHSYRNPSPHRSADQAREQMIVCVNLFECIYK